MGTALALLVVAQGDGTVSEVGKGFARAAVLVGIVVLVFWLGRRFSDRDPD